MKTHLYLILGLSISLTLSACGGGDTPTEEVAAPVEEVAAEAPAEEQPVEEQPAVEEPATEPEAPAEAEVVEEAPPAAPIEVLREALAANVANPDLINATLFQLMSIPAANGESMVFHFENQVGETNIGCTGYALAKLQDDSSYALADETVNISCRPVTSIEPITHFSSTSIDETGQPVLVIFGEVYSADVVAIRISAGDTQVNSLISGGGHFATLPIDSTGVVAQAFNAAGEQIYESEVRLPGEELPENEE